MCFVIHHNHTKPETASQDIHVFKLLSNYIDGHQVRANRANTVLVAAKKAENYGNPLPVHTPELRAPYYNHFIYVLGVEQSQEIGEVLHDLIEKGLHSHGSQQRSDDFKIYDGSRQTFHAVIPKGATYYHNPDTMEYVSNKLTVTKPCYMAPNKGPTHVIIP